MKGDFTRSTFCPEKQYSSVRMQQGRVQLDSDWNEQIDIEMRAEQLRTRDLMGQSGVPNNFTAAGQTALPAPEAFNLQYIGNSINFGSVGMDLVAQPMQLDSQGCILPHRIYVDGWLLEVFHASQPVTVGFTPDGTLTTLTLTAPTLEDRPIPAGAIVWFTAQFGGVWSPRLVGVAASNYSNPAKPVITLSTKLDLPNQSQAKLSFPMSYLNQPFLPAAPAPLTSLNPNQYHLVYLEVRQRHVTALEDPNLGESALGGPDSGTRTRLIWQIKTLPLGADPAPGRVQLGPNGTGWQNNPALTPAIYGSMAAVFSGQATDLAALENRLYRVEIMQGGASTAATFKWSRDNGSLAASWLGMSGTNLVVAKPAIPDSLAFAPGQWLELTDERMELPGGSSLYVQITGQIDASGINLSIPVGTPTSGQPLSAYTFGSNPRVRRWEGIGVQVSTDPKRPNALENGISVYFDAAGTYRSADAWLIPARPNRGGIEWPQTGSQPSMVSAQFNERRYAPLAILKPATFGGNGLITAVGTLEDVRPKVLSLSDSQKKLTADLAAGIAPVATFNGRVTTLETRANNLENRATTLEGRATSLEGRTAPLENRATSLETRANNLETRVGLLEGRVTALENRQNTVSLVANFLPVAGNPGTGSAIFENYGGVTLRFTAATTKWQAILPFNPPHGATLKTLTVSVSAVSNLISELTIRVNGMSNGGSIQTAPEPSVWKLPGINGSTQLISQDISTAVQPGGLTVVDNNWRNWLLLLQASVNGACDIRVHYVKITYG